MPGFVEGAFLGHALHAERLFSFCLLSEQKTAHGSTLERLGIIDARRYPKNNANTCVTFNRLGLRYGGMMLEILGYKGSRIFEAELSDDKRKLRLTEMCDMHFEVDLTRDQVYELIQDLWALWGEMKS